MYHQTPRRLLPLLMLALIVFCIPALPGSGRIQAAPSGVPPAGVLQQAGVIPRAYMPLIMTSAIANNNVTVAFSTSVSGGHIGTPQTTFPYGTSRIWYEAKFTNVKGQTYHLEWFVNNVHLVDLDTDGTVEYNNFSDVSYIDAGGDPSLACGTYIRKVYLNGQFAAQATAIVLPQTEPCLGAASAR